LRVRTAHHFERLVNRAHCVEHNQSKRREEVDAVCQAEYVAPSMRMRGARE
jgi:hypothetical protein